MTFKRFDVVRVHYPFTDQKTSKLRPALVLSNDDFNRVAKHSVFAMITSSKRDKWPGDCDIVDLNGAGLSKPSLVRMKIFTLDHRFVEDKIGHFAGDDNDSVWRSLSTTFLSKADGETGL